MQGTGDSILQNIHLDDYSANPKYLQVADSIKQAVLEGHLKIDDTLPSINELSFELAVSRDTIEKSYRKLKGDGILGSVPGKGFFIKTNDIEKQLKVFLLFNKLSEHKKIIYDAFAATVGDKASIDFYIYNNDFSIFKKLLARHIGAYSHYVIIPHFIEGHEHAYQLIDTLPKDKLLLLDKLIPQIKGEYAAVYENFEKNIYEAMEQALPQLSKYHSIKLIFPEHTYYPDEIIKGLKRFCHQYAFNFSVIHEIENSVIEKGTTYINVMERDLVLLIEKILEQKLQVGKEVGVISYNEIPLKKIILKGIATVSTDFHLMGKAAGQLILNNSRDHVEVPFHLTLRDSL
ncbi:MAG TPA: GntR family transcriptional regulator [Cyclobacteriaceae bacterium]|nr:GntR family transcriptional regulator [Cyclobacteriaceae bacterium]